jgi:hypothetical protein
MRIFLCSTYALPALMHKVNRNDDARLSVSICHVRNFSKDFMKFLLKIHTKYGPETQP